jgi:adenylosuccinate lyase
MRSERICALSRLVIESLGNMAHTAANQWLERTLDDSANRRLALAESFLATDAVLNLYLDVSSGLVVYPAVIKRNLDAELPFLATESLMMEAVRTGGDRQDLHERIRIHSHAAAAEIKAGGESDLRDRIRHDPAFAAVAGRLDELLDGSRFVGRAPEQVAEFIAEEVDPLLELWAEVPTVRAEVRV